MPDQHQAFFDSWNDPGHVEMLLQLRILPIHCWVITPK